MLDHLAIIMDGNGRYAKKIGKKRIIGHNLGTKKLKEIAIYASQIGIKYLSVYAFSTENWSRPKEEVNHLMKLTKVFFKAYFKDILENNIKVITMGDLSALPLSVQEVFNEAINKSSHNTGMILNIAINYGARSEIVNACKSYAKDCLEHNELLNLDEQGFQKYLLSNMLPDVDLLIRTSGELRLSNFMLYQIAYSELIFINKFWPEFEISDLDECITIFKQRSRRFGALDET